VSLGGSDLSNYTATLVTPHATHLPTGGFTIAATPTAPTQAGAQMPGQAAGTPPTASASPAPTATPTTCWTRSSSISSARFEHLVLHEPEFGGRAEHNKFTSVGSRNTALGALTQNITPDMAAPRCPTPVTSSAAKRRARRLTG
jgi:hypothetical protein